MNPKPGTPEWFRHSSERAASARPDINRELPWQVWVCIGILILASVAQLAPLISKGSLVPLVTIPLQAAVAYGLYLGKRWAFFTFEFFAFASLLVAGRAPAAALINVGLGVALLTASDHFFPSRS